MNFAAQTCEAFILALSSKEPIPGGGGASALVGAVGTALGNMVGSLTLGKKKYADVQDAILALKSKADSLQKELLSLISKDAELFEPLSKAYGLPQNTEEEKAQKARIMEDALQTACTVPLAIMQKCCKAIQLHQEFAAKGTAIAISDVGVGVAFCKAALLGASLNVFINTKSMANRPYAEDINKQAKSLLDTYTRMADEIYASVAARFN